MDEVTLRQTQAVMEKITDFVRSLSNDQVQQLVDGELTIALVDVDEPAVDQ